MCGNNNHDVILNRFRNLGLRPTELTTILSKIKTTGNYMKSLQMDHPHKNHVNKHFGVQVDLSNARLLKAICKKYGIRSNGSKRNNFNIISSYLQYPETRHRLQKGALCSQKGNEYEGVIHSILEKCFLNNKPFHTQSSNELGGSSSDKDICCNFVSKNDIGIEVKKSNSPDWMQCRIIFSTEENKWIASSKSKNNDKCLNIFNNILKDICIYDGDIPPFETQRLSLKRWNEIKGTTDKWNDTYHVVPCDTIRKLYWWKGCQYIQVSSYGLYHLGEDVCGFGVPLFETEQMMRIRTKVHKRKDHNNFCVLSIMASCKPKNVKNIKKSPYSLDNIKYLPLNLTHRNLHLVE